MQSLYDLGMATAWAAQERERALRQAALLREARAAAPATPGARRWLAAILTILAARLDPSLPAPASRPAPRPLGLERSRAADPPHRSMKRAA